MTYPLLKDNLQERDRKVREGLDHILTLIGDSSYVWSQGRWISTYARTDEGKEQRFRVAYSKEEALAFFKAANYLDCRIRAYHVVENFRTIVQEPVDQFFDQEIYQNALEDNPQEVDRLCPEED